VNDSPSEPPMTAPLYTIPTLTHITMPLIVAFLPPSPWGPQKDLDDFHNPRVFPHAYRLLGKLRRAWRASKRTTGRRKAHHLRTVTRYRAKCQNLGYRLCAPPGWPIVEYRKNP
jgi:hypothetical protein